MRAGFTSDGPPARLSQVRTLRNSLARRIALKRPRVAELNELEAEIAALEALGGEPTAEQKELLIELKARRTHIEALRRMIPFIDPLDLRYSRFDRIPKPTTQAVMFCLMDVSASMTEELKDLAKRFFMLLHVFLVRHYKAVDVVFIRHTTEAAEVDEETFFHGRETGGTVISSALDVMLEVIKERYPVSDWNIYAAQASDGHNFDDDMARCIKMLDEDVLPLCQYFAYIEVSPPQSGSRTPDNSVVWSGYEELTETNAHFAMKRVASPGRHLSGVPRAVCPYRCRGKLRVHCFGRLGGVWHLWWLTPPCLHLGGQRTGAPRYRRDSAICVNHRPELQVQFR